MTSTAELVAAGVEWLRYERACYIVALERGPWDNHMPDILGVEPARHTIEIEIKRSVADFKNDAEKKIWMARDLWKQSWPQQFYYLVSPEIVMKVREHVRDGFGLLTLQPSLHYERREIVAVKPARKQKDARRLTLRQMLLMVRAQSGTVSSLARRLVAPAEAAWDQGTGI